MSLISLDKEIITKINKSIAAGKLVNRGGKKIIQHIDGGLLRADKVWVYPIREDIPIMLINEAIEFAPFE